jgi:hypothetical protein
MQTERDQLSDRVTTLLGFSELLLEGAYGSLEQDQRRVLEDMVEAARDLKEMVRSDRRAFSID